MMGSVRRPASTTTTSTRTLAFASAAERPACSGASCSCTAAATQPGSATASKSPPTVPASGPEHARTPTRTQTHVALHAPSAGSKALLQCQTLVLQVEGHLPASLQRGGKSVILLHFAWKFIFACFFFCRIVVLPCLPIIPLCK